MKLDLEFQVVPEQALEDSTKAEPFVIPDVPTQPDFIETFQQIIDGLAEQIALVDDQWVILAVNKAWTRTAALYGYEALIPGTDYLAFCDARAIEGHTAAALAAEGIREMMRKGEPAFSFVYEGQDRWKGFAFQLCVRSFVAGGQVYRSVTRYDVSELVHLRQMRGEYGHSVIEQQSEERRRLAREVHDSTMQLLAGLGLSIGQLRASKRAKLTGEIANEMEQLLGEAQRELRAMSFLAHPPVVRELGLARAIRQLAGGFARRTGLNIATSVDGALSLSPAAEGAIYRFVQEGLSNIHRHAQATDAAIGFYQRRSVLFVAVVDNGIGMPDHVRRGVGLASMRERIDELGGRLMIRAGSPGTVLIASIPAHAEIRSVGDLAQAI